MTNVADILNGALALIFAVIYLFTVLVAIMAIYNARRFSVEKDTDWKIAEAAFLAVSALLFLANISLLTMLIFKSQ